MYTIHGELSVTLRYRVGPTFSFGLFISLGEKEMEEIELSHLEGHKQSSPVRIGNGAANHVQLVRLAYEYVVHDQC